MLVDHIHDNVIYFFLHVIEIFFYAFMILEILPFGFLKKIKNLQVILYFIEQVSHATLFGREKTN